MVSVPNSLNQVALYINESQCVLQAGLEFVQESDD